MDMKIIMDFLQRKYRRLLAEWKHIEDSTDGNARNGENNKNNVPVPDHGADRDEEDSANGHSW